MEMGEKGDHCVPVSFLSLSNMSGSFQIYAVCSITMKMYLSDILFTSNLQQLLQNQKLYYILIKLGNHP